MILEIITFLAGIHCMMMLLAAIYRIVDLWYRIGDFWPGIVLRLALIVGLTGLLVLILGEELRTVFLWGQASYLAFHVSAYWLARIGIWIINIARN